jgi:TorA maturation chaperone TorD
MPDEAASARSVFEKLEVENDAREPQDHLPVRLLTTSALALPLSERLVNLWPSPSLKTFWL